MRTLRFKRKYFEMIRSGRKTLECRIKYPSINEIKVGDLVRYFWESHTYDVKIIAVRRYGGF